MLKLPGYHSPNDRMPALSSRLQYLRNAEALCCLALPLALCLHWHKSAAAVAWELRAPALALVCYLLLQGVLYWHLKLGSVVRRQPLPAYFQPLFRVLKTTNLFCIAAVAAFVSFVAFFAARSSAGTPLADLAWSYGLLAFAVLEHINYYHYQLMYDTRAALASLRRNGRLRKAALGLDLRRQVGA